MNGWIVNGWIISLLIDWFDGKCVNSELLNRKWLVVGRLDSEWFDGLWLDCWTVDICLNGSIIGC